MLGARRWRSLYCLATIAVCIVVATPAEAQKLGNNSDTEDPAKSKKFGTRWEQLVKGTATPDPNSDKALLELAGRYFVYRCTWPEEQQNPYDAGMGRIQLEFKKIMDVGTKAA